jgi:uncharacterized protein (DUF885 family)
MNLDRSSLSLPSVAVVVLLLPTTPAIQQDIASLPPDPEAYQQIIRSRGRVPDAERLEQLIARFRGEQAIERIDRAESDGQRILWVSQSPATLDIQRRLDGLRLQALHSVDVAGLNAGSRLDWRVLEHLFETRAGNLQAENAQVFPTFQRVDPPYGSLADPPQTFSDFEDRIAWLRGVPRTLIEAQAILQRGMTRGIIADRQQAEEGLAAVRASVTENPLDSPYLAVFKNFPATMSLHEQQQLIGQAAEVYRGLVVPAYATYVRFLEQSYLPATRPSASLATLPDGQARYAWLMDRNMGVRISPEDVHRSALAEVERLHAELTRMARNAGFSGTSAEFLTSIRRDPKCGPLEAAAASREFHSLMEQVARGLPRLFTTLPKTSYELESVPDLPFAFGGATVSPGSLKEGRPGRVRVKTPVTNACSFVHVMLHEGVPGHLLQAHIANESKTVSPFRRDWAGSGAYAEGWAQYASGLAGELGLELHPYVRAERIAGEIFMAGRAAVETGIHWHGWSAERAAAYYREVAPWAPAPVVEGVVRGALTEPARQSAYMIGHQKLLALRTSASAELGGRFTIPAFHAAVLNDGPMPLRVLEQQISDWVAREKRRR